MSKIMRCKSFFVGYLLPFLLSLALCAILFFSCTLRVFAESNNIDLVHHHRGDSAQGGGCFNTPVYHTHQGDTSSGGTCYTPVYHSHSSSCYSYTSCYKSAQSISIASESSTYCSYHGNVTTITYAVTYYHDYEKCYSTDYVTINCTSCGGNAGASETHYISTLSCGKSAGSIDSYTLNCAKSPASYVEYYDTNCGLNENTTYGNLSFNITDSEWTSGNVTISASLEDPDGVLTQNGYGKYTFSTDNGSIASWTTTSIEVSENGNYYVKLSVDDNLFDSADAEIMVTVSNIDRTAPTIESISYDHSDKLLPSNNITVTASDKQPDGSPGSGLADEAYSFDGGITYQADNSFECTENGTIEVYVRDRCGNTAKETVVINNIDSTSPSVEYSLYPDPWYTTDQAPRSITITAFDDGIGLHDMPYSFDEGKTWTNLNKHYYSEEGTFKVLVRDKYSNTTTLTIESTKVAPPPKDDSKDNGGNSDNNSGNDSNKNGDNNSGSNKNGNNSSGDNDHDNQGINPTNDEENNIDARNNNGASQSSQYNLNKKDIVNAKIGPQLTPSTILSDNKKTNTDDQESTHFSEEIRTSQQDPDTKATTISLPKRILSDQTVTAVATATGCLTGILVLLFGILMLFSFARIYSYDGTKYRFIGLALIYKSEKGHTLSLSENLLDRMYSSRIKLKPGPIFVKLHDKDLITVKYEKKIKQGIISKAIILDLDISV